MLQRKLGPLRREAESRFHHQAARAAKKPPFEVHVVFTWVDNTAEHAELRQKYLAKEGTLYGQALVAAGNDSAQRMDSSGNELLFAVRSVLRFMKWVTCIWILVADGQRPAWLRPDSDQLAGCPVRLCFHSQVFDPECLPSFSSRGIESRMREIPGMAERFLYFNDDMLVGRPVSWSDFFYGKHGRPYTLTNGDVIFEKVRKFIDAKEEPRFAADSLLCKHFQAVISSCRMVKRVTPKDHRGVRVTWRSFPRIAHQATPMCLKWFRDAEANPIINEALTRTAQHRFRMGDDILVTRFLPYWALQRGRSKSKKIDQLMFNVKDGTNLLDVGRKILQKRPALFCINDALEGNRQAQKKGILELLEFLFPEKCPAEI